MRLVCLIHCRPGRAGELAAYEDRVLAILEERYGGKVVQRITCAEGPTEVQVLEVPDEAALDAFMADAERTALAPLRDAAIARTEIFREA